MSFRIGQKVVCIVDGDWVPLRGSTMAHRTPSKGKIYEVTGIHSCPGYPDYFGVTLSEFGLWLFDADQFRPLKKRKRKYDISVFTDMLKECETESVA